MGASGPRRRVKNDIRIGMKRSSRLTLAMTAIIVVALVIDQVLKVYVKTHFALGETYPITSWFYICFVENDGMAFGIEWFDKLFLTLFRMVAVVLLCWYSYVQVWRREAVRGSYLCTLALVIAGALGNIIDCVFYGRIWGYAGWFYGRVVDMLYFPIITDSAGETLFFRPVFNFADACITSAVIAILIWFRSDLDESLKTNK